MLRLHVSSTDVILQLFWNIQCNEVIVSVMASKITGVTIVYSTVCSGEDKRKLHSSASLAFVKGTGEFPAQRARELFPFDYVIVSWRLHWHKYYAGLHGTLVGQASRREIPFKYYSWNQRSFSHWLDKPQFVPRNIAMYLVLRYDTYSSLIPSCWCYWRPRGYRMPC